MWLGQCVSEGRTSLSGCRDLANAQHLRHSHTSCSHMLTHAARGWLVGHRSRTDPCEVPNTILRKHGAGAGGAECIAFSNDGLHLAVGRRVRS